MEGNLDGEPQQHMFPQMRRCEAGERLTLRLESPHYARLVRNGQRLEDEERFAPDLEDEATHRLGWGIGARRAAFACDGTQEERSHKH